MLSTYSLIVLPVYRWMVYHVTFLEFNFVHDPYIRGNELMKKKSKLLRSLETERSSHLVQFPFVQQIIVPVKFLQFSTPHYLHGVVRQPRFVFHLSILPLSLGAYISLSKRQFPSRRGQIALLLPCGMEKGSYLCFTNHSSLITLLGVGGFRHLSSSTDVPSTLLGITRGVLSVSMDHSPPLSQLVVFSY